jgi:cell division protein FtsQ
VSGRVGSGAARPGRGGERPGRADGGDRPGRPDGGERSVRGRRTSGERVVSDRGRRVSDRGRVRRRSALRGRIIRRRVIALTLVLGTLGLLYGVYFTPLLGVRSVEVLGTKDLTKPQVLDAAAVPSGNPMLTINLAAIRDRVAALNRVASVNVSRSWPATVRIDVAERVAVGVIKTPTGAHLIDHTAKDFATVAAAPAGLPELQLTSSAANDPTAVAVVQVLMAVPDKIRAEVLSVSAKSPNSVVLALSAGRQVRWGGAADSPRKAAVLAALMSQPGKVYDVSSPQLATISNP